MASVKSRPSHFARPASSPSTDASRLTPHAALVIFAKAPIPGEVNTRLCPPLTPDEAATLHGSFILDMLERTKLAVGSSRRGSGPADTPQLCRLIRQRLQAGNHCGDRCPDLASVGVSRDIRDAGPLGCGLGASP